MILSRSDMTVLSRGPSASRRFSCAWQPWSPVSKKREQDVPGRLSRSGKRRYDLDLADDRIVEFFQILGRYPVFEMRTASRVLNREAIKEGSSDPKPCHIACPARRDVPVARDLDRIGLGKDRIEPVHCAEMGIEFLSFPIPDRGVPESYRRTLDLVKTIAAASLQGNAAIHCRAGIGRSSLIAASVVVSLGFDSDHAFEMIQAARGLPVPDTVQQRVWVSSFEDWLRAYDGIWRTASTGASSPTDRKSGSRSTSTSYGLFWHSCG